MAYRWGGRLCLSWNNVPAFGKLRRAFSRPAVRTGSVLERTFPACSRQNWRFRRLPTDTEMLLKSATPSRTFPWIGANATMRWKELSAGRGV